MKIPNTKSVLETAVKLETTVNRVLQMIKDKKLDAINMNEGGKRPRWAIPDTSIDALSKPKTVSVAKRIPRHV